MNTPKLKEYNVCLPITGYLWTTVEAESEDAAIKVAMDGDLKTDDIEEWNVHRQVTQGNVCHAMLNDAYAECQDLEDDEEEVSP